VLVEVGHWKREDKEDVVQLGAEIETFVLSADRHVAIPSGDAGFPSLYRFWTCEEI
jgi:hypothetical protein